MAAKRAPKPKADSATRSSSVRTRSTTNNRGNAIDFGSGKSRDEITADQAQERGVWPKRLQALLDGVRDGQGEPDTFYCIGSFSTPSGAQTVIRELSRRPERLPGGFDMEKRVVVADDGTRTSELWAAVPAEELHQDAA